MGKVVPKWQADLPVKVKFEKLVGKELRLSSRDYAIALLNDKVRSISGVRSTETFTYLKLHKQTYSWGTR